MDFAFAFFKLADDVLENPEKENAYLIFHTAAPGCLHCVRMQDFANGVR